MTRMKVQGKRKEKKRRSDHGPVQVGQSVPDDKHHRQLARMDQLRGEWPND